MPRRCRGCWRSLGAADVCSDEVADDAVVIRALFWSYSSLRLPPITLQGPSQTPSVWLPPITFPDAPPVIKMPMSLPSAALPARFVPMKLPTIVLPACLRPAVQCRRVDIAADQVPLAQRTVADAAAAADRAVLGALPQHDAPLEAPDLQPTDCDAGPAIDPVTPTGLPLKWPPSKMTPALLPSRSGCPRR